MQEVLSDAQTPQPFPAIRGLLKQRKHVLRAGAAGVGLMVAWLAWRTGYVELYPVAAVLAMTTYYVLKVAGEVVELVAETLMPR